MLEVRIKRKLPGFKLEVDFTVNQEILAILGPSGSGKTMTLQCIAGLIRPDEGFVKLNEKVLLDSASGLNTPTQERNVGFVFQNYALFPHLTVSQNIAFGICKRPSKEIKERVTELLEKMNIQRLGDRYPRQLSAGQQQRVAVARALAPEPGLLLLDEPFSALDSLVKERLQLELQTLQKFYKGNILFVTHDLAEGYKLSSKIAVFDSGHIVQCDDKEKVVSCPSRHSVARLVGFKNLMEGLVVGFKDGGVIIQVPELGGIIRSNSPNAANLSIDNQVTIGVRPEYIQIVEGPGENTILSMLDTVVEGVAAINYYFHVKTVGATRHYIMVISSKQNVSVLKEGQSCYLRLPPEHIAVITG